MRGVVAVDGQKCDKVVFLPRNVLSLSILIHSSVVDLRDILSLTYRRTQPFPPPYSLHTPRSIDSLTCKPKQPNASDVSRPPQQAPRETLLVILNVIVRQRVRRPDDSINQRVPVHQPSVETSLRSKKDRTNEEWEMLHRVRMRGRQTLQPVQLLLCDLAGLYGRRTVGREVFARVHVVVDAQIRRDEARAGRRVGHDEVEDDKVRCVRGDGGAGQGVGGRGPKA